MALLAGVSAAAGEKHFSSGPGRVSLIELYTSEGCSSCPPAERWLGTLQNESGLWRDFVPVEFHVNYWDRLGWPDRFASKEFTDREYAYSRAWSSDSVYTPCVVRDGKESHMDQKIRAAGEDAGQLSLTIDEAGSCRAEFTPAGGAIAKREVYEVHVALLGGGFASKVTAGENRGATLPHEFVALALESHPLKPAERALVSDGFALPRTKISDGSRRALAVWVTRRGEDRPLQATGGWLD
jgi:hypothetical protein